MASIVILKVVVFLIFLVLYALQWKSVKTTEAKICFLYFSVFYFLGGGVVSIVIEDIDYFLPHAGLYQVKGSGLSWLLYYCLVYFLPYVLIWIVDIFTRNGSRSIQVKGLVNPTWLLFSLLFYLVVFFITNDGGVILDFEPSGYMHQIENRYSLTLHPVLQYFYLFGGFLITYNLMVSSISNKMVFIPAVFSCLVYLLVVERVFYSKLYLMGLASSVLFVFFVLSRRSLFKFLSIFLLSSSALFVYYSFSVYGEMSDIVPAFVRVVTRYAMPVYYYVDYYLFNDFEGGFYFSGTLGRDSGSYIQDLYDHAYVISVADVRGTLSSGLIVHNYANLGFFGFFLSCLEFSFLIFIYSFFRLRSYQFLNLAIFSFLIFSVMNYSFTSVLANPRTGLALTFIVLLAFNFLRLLKR